MFNIRNVDMSNDILLKDSLDLKKIYNKSLIEKHCIRLTTLTPVSIGSHEEPLSPIVDYVCDKGKIHFINQELFIKELIHKELIEEYELFISSISSQQENKHELFQKFLINNEITISSISNISRDFVVRGNLTEISKHINSSGRFYISGATIKGAIKQALFAYKYSDTNFVNAINKSHRGKKELYKDSSCFIKKPEEFFNAKKSKFLYNNSSFWGVEDTNFVNIDRTTIIQLDRKRLMPKLEEKDLTDLSVLQEAIKERTNLKVNLYFRTSKLDNITKDKITTYVTKQVFELPYFFKAINNFTKEFIKYQLSFVNSDELDEYKEQLENYLKIVEQFLQDNNRALLCIGFGKSMLQNSIALSVKNNWERLRIESPTTTFVEASTLQSIGWCLLEKENITPFNVSEYMGTLTKEYLLSDLSNKRKGDETVLQVQSLFLKPKKIIASSIQYGKDSFIEVTGIDQKKYKEGDWIKVKLSDKTKKEPQIFKQAKLIKKL